MSDLTPAQERLLGVLRADGYAGPSRARLSTTRALVRAGVAKWHTEPRVVSSYNRRSGRAHADLDWLIVPTDTPES